MSVGMEPAVRAHRRNREAIMDQDGLSALTRHYETRIGILPGITEASELPEKSYDAKSHAALESSRSFAPDEQVNGRYVGPASQPSLDLDDMGPFRYEGAFRGYSAGR